MTMSGTYPYPAQQPSNVGTTDPLFANAVQISGGMMRDVAGSVPYGLQRKSEKTDLDKRYKFFPGAAARLRAATRSALGR